MIRKVIINIVKTEEGQMIKENTMLRAIRIITRILTIIKATTQKKIGIMTTIKKTTIIQTFTMKVSILIKIKVNLGYGWQPSRKDSRNSRKRR